jgi:hypothetical protein
MDYLSFLKLHRIFFVLLCAMFLYVAPLSAQAKVDIAKVAVINITNTEATITWQSSLPGDSWVGYRLQSGGPQLSVFNLTSVTQHSMALTGLQPGSTYVYEVNTVTSQNDGGFIAGLTFTTKGGAVVSVPAQPTGTLAQDGSTIYFLMAKDKIKIPFTSMAAFTGLGYNLKNVKKLNLSSYALARSYVLSSATQEHPWGSWLKWKDGTLYYAGADGLIGVPSMSVFTSNGGKPEMIVPLNAADDAIWAQNPKLPVLQAGDSRVL